MFHSKPQSQVGRSFCEDGQTLERTGAHSHSRTRATGSGDSGAGASYAQEEGLGGQVRIM